MVNIGLMATILTLFIAMLLLALAWDWLRSRRRAAEQAAAVAASVWGRLPETPGRKRQFTLHWGWLLALAIVLAGGGLATLDWFADAQGQVVVGYSGR